MSTENLAQTIELLASKKPGEAREAEQALAKAGPAAAEALLAALARENAKKPKRFVWGAAIGALHCIVIATILGVLGANPGSFGYMYVMICAACGSALAPTRLQRALARRVAALDDLRAVGPLCEALDRQDAATKKIALGELPRLLLRLRASDRALLNAEQHKALCKAMAEGETEFRMAALHAIEQIGDETALPLVEALAKKKPSKKKNDESAIFRAREVLAALKERIEKEKDASTLLRPAMGQDAELLRPAGHGGGESAEELLRPATAQDHAEVAAPTDSEPVEVRQAH